MKIVKQSIGLFLAFAVLLQTAEKIIVITGYEINKEYIAKNLCENIDKLQMHCNGKCHLNKQLRETEKKEKTPLNTGKEKNEIQFFYEASLLEPATISTVKKFISYYLLKETSTMLSSVFHPPTT